jgi:multiple sugar transport system permease protein
MISHRRPLHLVDARRTRRQHHQPVEPQRHAGRGRHHREGCQQFLVDGCSIWGAFFRIILPIALPGMVAAFILSVILCWNEYFFAALLTSSYAKTLPVMVASQTGSQGISWWSMAALSSAAILPLIIIGIFLERYIVKGLTTGSVK